MGEPTRHPSHVEVIPHDAREGASLGRKGRDLARTEERIGGDRDRHQAPSRRPRWGPLLVHVPGVKTALALWFYMMDEQADPKHRLAILASLIYLVVPFDLIHDVLVRLFGFGILDDIAVIFGLLQFLGSGNLAPYREQARRWLLGLPPIEPDPDAPLD